MMRRKALGISSLLLASLPGYAARAEPVPEPPASFSLELVAGDCPTTDAQLLAAIATRVPNAVRVDGPADVGIRAELSSQGLSSVTITLAQGSSRREFPGASCEEASAIIGFISALVLDARPEDRLKATELAGVTEPKPQKAPEPTPKPEPKPEPKPAPAPSTADHEPSKSTPLRFGISAALAYETAVAPTPPLAGLFGLSASLRRNGWLSPELRAALLLTGTSTEPADVGQVSFSLIAGRLSLCPVRSRLLTDALVVGACATFDAGSLRAQGDSRVNGQQSAMPWLAGGVGALAELRLNPSFELELQLGVRLLAYSDTFTLKPDPSVMTSEPAPRIQVYEVPRVSAGLALGLGFSP